MSTRRDEKHLLARERYSAKEIRDRGNYVDRCLRLRALASHFQVTRCFPMLYEAKVPAELSNMLTSSTKQYLFASMNATREHKLFDLSADVLVQHRKELAGLINRTPNGLIIPKRENSLEYNLVCRSMGEIVHSVRGDDFMDSILFPPMVRMVDGIWNAQDHKRPYASTKVHIDIWNGDQPAVLPIFVPILGDIGRTTIEFWEPDERAMRSSLRTFDDYDAGAALVGSATKYQIEMRHGHMYLADSLLLHQTIRTGGALRVSLEFRFIPKVTVASDWIGHGHSQPDWRKNFCSLKEFYATTRDKFLVVNDTFADTARRFKAPARAAKTGNKKTGNKKVRNPGSKAAKPLAYRDYFRAISLVS